MKKPASRPAKRIRSLSDLTPDDRNANKGTERGLSLLENSLRKYGAGRSILADREGRVIAGNKTLERAAELGLPVQVVETNGEALVVVQRQDLDLKRDKAARELAIADNRVAELDLEWDAAELRRLLDEGVALDAFFSEDELQELISELQDEAAVQEDSAPLDKAAELQLKWGTAAGQLWVIPSLTSKGQHHRLLCGDSTNEAHVRALVDGARPHWMWTDPPYGVEYEGKTKDKLRIENDGAADLPGLLRAAFTRADAVLVEGAPIYVSHAAGALAFEFARAFLEVGWHWHQTLIWAKDTIVLGRSDYHYQHEPILYGWKGKNRVWCGGRDQSSLLTIARPQANDMHPTMKPVELVARCLQNSSKPGSIGYEPFAGSGTTFVAAEQVGRLCYGLELNPKYAAVVLERLSTHGLQPKLHEKNAA